MDVLKFISKWLHLLSIISVLGSSIFAWLTLVPATRNAREDDSTARAVWRGFGVSLGVFWFVILLTGFFNLFVIASSVNKTYHAFLGGKIALALVMFVLSMCLVHPSPSFERFRSQRAQWLLILVTLGAIVVGLSAHLNMSRISGAALERPSASNPS